MMITVWKEYIKPMLIIVLVVTIAFLDIIGAMAICTLFMKGVTFCP